MFHSLFSYNFGQCGQASGECILELVLSVSETYTGKVRCFQMLRVFDLSFDGNYLNSSGSLESLLMCSKSISIEKLF